MKSFLTFCEDYELSPLPASTQTITRYAAFLARSKCFSSVSQYLNIIRIIHVNFGHPNPLEDKWQIKAILKGIKRVKSNAPSFNQKMPLLPVHLLSIHSKLDLSSTRHMQIWAAILCGFFGLLRVSNICGKYAVLRKDMKITSQGIILNVTRSKTIQFQQKVHSVVIPFIKGHVLCPVTAMLQFLAASPSDDVNLPMFAIALPRGDHSILTPQILRSNINRLASLCPDIPNCSCHSLRKGGATWLLMCNVPLATIKIIGDWSSDAVFKYLLPDTGTKFSALTHAISSLP